MNPILAKAAAAWKAITGGGTQPAAGGMTLDQIIQPNARDRWGGRIARDYTPERVEYILRGALNGNLIDQHELFNLMEETSPRINKNLNQRKRAVVAHIRRFEDWAEEDQAATDEAKHRTKVAAAALRTMKPKVDSNENGFDETIYDILDATGKGIALIEIDWEVRKAGSLGMISAPRATRWVHPRFYGFAMNADWLGLNTNQIESAAAGNTTEETPPPRLSLKPVNGIYARVPENKFLVCIRKSKSGSPISGGLLRQLAFWWCASQFTQSWVLNFAQIFGLPIRWATYDPNMPGLMEKVCAMLDNMGSAAWGAFPSGTQLELKEPPKASSENPQFVLLNLADKQYDLLILGQSGTTQISGPGEKSGGSHAANKVLQGVEEQIVRSDADFVCNIINHQLIAPTILFNFGDTEMLPQLCLDPMIEEDIAGLVENYNVATVSGVLTPNPDDEAFLRKKLLLPQMSADVVASWKASKNVRTKTGGQPTKEPADTDVTLTGQAHAAPPKFQLENSRLVDAALADAAGIAPRWLGAVRPIFEQLIAKAKADAVTDDDFIAAVAKAQKDLPGVFDKLDHAALARVIEQTRSAGVVNGALQGALDRRGMAVAK